MINYCKILCLFGTITLFSIKICQCRVLELDERFREAKHTGEWMVMFYAPWCGHCKQLEPTWMELGDAMEGLMPVHVARLDCTKYSELSKEFSIRGFPTIKYVKGDAQYEYRGARTKNDIIAFAEKARGAKLRVLTNIEEIKAAQKKHEVFFMYVGNEDTELRTMYRQVAEFHFLVVNFYAVTPDVWPSEDDTPTVLVFKDGTQHKMPMSAKTVARKQISLWISTEQKSDFSELTGGSYQDIKNTKKMFAVAVLPKNNPHNIKEIAKKIGLSRHELYHPKFIFCWVNGNTIINRMTYDTITPPNMVVFNPENYEYFVLNNDLKSTMSEDSVKQFLSDIIEGKLTPLGGSGIIQQAKHLVTDLVSMLVKFFQNSPILASLVIGVPTFVITFICYCICTMEDVPEDDMDSENEYEEEEQKLPEYEAEESEVRKRNIEHEDGENDEGGSDSPKSGGDAETDKDK